MNEPETKIGRNGHGSWTAETYTLGHLITTSKYGKHVVSYARLAQKEVTKFGTVYQYDPIQDPSFELEREQFKRVTSSSVDGVHTRGLAKFFELMECPAGPPVLPELPIESSLFAGSGDAYSDFWDVVIAPTAAQVGPQNLNANREGE